MNIELTAQELEELQSQLSCPKGKRGVEVAHIMNESNKGMTLESLNRLNIMQHHSILELGHGNGGHLSQLLQMAKDIQYFGLEISSEMKKEAERINQDLSKKHTLNFKLYDGESIPASDNQFDRVVTVNTVYFWKDPQKLMSEIFRVLKVGGSFAIGYVQKHIMEELPFVLGKFELYDNQAMEALINQSPFVLSKIHNLTEQVKTKTGDLIDREFSVAVLTKPWKLP